MAYEVGQIVYYVNQSTHRIVPMQIREEVRRRTLSGEAVTFLVQRDETDRLHPLEGEVYSSVEEALSVLRRNFESYLLDQVAWTEERRREWFGEGPTAPVPNGG